MCYTLPLHWSFNTELSPFSSFSSLFGTVRGKNINLRVYFSHVNTLCLYFKKQHQRYSMCYINMTDKSLQLRSWMLEIFWFFVICLFVLLLACLCVGASQKLHFCFVRDHYLPPLKAKIIDQIAITTYIQQGGVFAHVNTSKDLTFTMNYSSLLCLISRNGFPILFPLILSLL